MRRGQVWRLAPAYALVAPAFAAAVAGAIMLIELANHQLAAARSEGSAMSLLGFDVDSATAPPWIIAIVLIGAGVGGGRLLWPRVVDAWSAVHARLRAGGEA